MATATPRPSRAPRPRGRPRGDSAVPGPELSREKVLHAALALIDERGLADFNLRELATRLGVYPAAVYWYVPGRDALVAGVVELALRGAGAPVRGGPWQQRLRRLLVRYRSLLQQHPHLAPVVAGELVRPQALDAPLLDQILAALEDAGFEGAALVDAFNVVIAAMCGFATLELSRPPGDAAWGEAFREGLDTLDLQPHPALARHLPRLRGRAFMLRWAGGDTQPLDRSFGAWIDVLLRGLESRAEAAARSPRRPRRAPLR